MNEDSFILGSASQQCNVSTANHKCIRYLRRIFKFNQMDFQFALWQMLYLFISPQKLIQLFKARKHSKHQYARDDPAFLILFSGFLCITTICLSIVLQLTFFQFLKFLIFIIFVDCICFGIIVATIFWYLTNTILNPKTNVADVEWGYSFDIHLNALFPPLLLLHFFQLFFYNSIISHDWLISILLGNTFWLCSSFYYFYITFLGYNALQMFNTKYFLLPIPWCICFYFLCLIFSLNISHIILNFYKYRVL